MATEGAVGISPRCAQVAPASPPNPKKKKKKKGEKKKKWFVCLEFLGTKGGTVLVVETRPIDVSCVQAQHGNPLHECNARC